MRTLTRKELTAALAVRQGLDARRGWSAAEAVRTLTPLQGQEPQAPFVALAARIEGFERGHLEAAVDAGEVVKTTIMRRTLHLAAATDYAAFHQVARQPWLRSLRTRYPHLDEQRVTSELRAFVRTPRTNAELRGHIGRYEGVPQDEWSSILIARTLLPLVQLPPAGHWDDRRRPRFAVHPGRLPSPAAAAELVLRRYLAAYGPASRKDVAAWSGTAQRDLAPAFDRVETVSFRDEKGAELLDLPGAPLPPASTRLPVRLLSRWEQPLLAYADRDRIIPPELLPLRLTLSGDQTITVDGRVCASWLLRKATRSARLEVRPHRAIPKRAHAQIRAEAKLIARLAAPAAERVEVTGL